MPFDTEHINFRIAKIDHRQMEKDDEEIGLVEMLLELNPFTAALAGELDDYVKSMLFTRTDGEVRSKLRRVVFDLPIKPQSIAFRMAPDQGKASFTIDEAKVSSIAVARSKKSSAWTLKLRIVFAPESPQQLHQAVECYLKSRYLTFAQATPGLFDEAEKEERKRKAPPVKGQTVSDDGATTH
jgi:hypothetical protein